jgi:perosamine synthetase
MLDNPGRKHLSLSQPLLNGQEWTYVKACLDAGWVSYAGGYVNQFEEELARRTASTSAIAVVNGTSALHLALRLLGVQQDDEVLMPALSFVAPANAIRYCGAWPTFVDVIEGSWQLDLDQLEEFLCGSAVDGGCLINRVTGRRIAAICVVHLFGSMADIDEAHRIAARFNLPIVEDAAECLGAEYKGRKIGENSTDFDDIRRIVVTSFNANKIITTGGGGALLCNDADDADRARHLATTAKTDAYEFVHDDIGYNYRMPNVSAAIGLAQLEQLDDRLKARRVLASSYMNRLSSIDEVTPMQVQKGVNPNYWLYTVRIAKEHRRPLMSFLLAEGIEVRPPWTPLPMLNYLKCCHATSSSNAVEAHHNCLSLPSGPEIGNADVERIALAIERFMERNN